MRTKERTMDEKSLYKLDTLREIIQALGEEMDYLYSRMIYKPLKYSERVITSVPDSGLEEDFAKIDTVRAKLQRRQAEYIDAYDRATGRIFELDDPREQLLLLLKYGHGASRSEICERLKCSKATFYRIQESALRHYNGD